MKRRNRIRHLIDHGCELVREGGNSELRPTLLIDEISYEILDTPWSHVDPVTAIQLAASASPDALKDAH